MGDDCAVYYTMNIINYSFSTLFEFALPTRGLYSDYIG